MSEEYKGPVGELTDEEILGLALECGGEPVETIGFARAVISRLGNIAPQPIPLSERKPGPEDCDGLSGLYCWYGSVGIGMGVWEWVLEDPTDDPVGYTHWLPASVDYLPARVAS